MIWVVCRIGSRSVTQSVRLLPDQGPRLGKEKGGSFVMAGEPPDVETSRGQSMGAGDRVAKTSPVPCSDRQSSTPWR